MHLKEIRIKQLFGHFDHVIPLNTKERLTIITAPNGYGKTIVLNLLQAFYKCDIGYFASVAFASIDIVFENSFVRIEKNDDVNMTISLFKDEASEPEPESTFRIESIVKFEDLSFSREDILQTIKTHKLNITEHTSNFWHDKDRAALLDTDAFINQYRRYLEQSEYSLPQWYLSITTDTKVHLIRDQRLIMRHDNNIDQKTGFQPAQRTTQITDSIERFANELKQKIHRCNTDYSEVSKKLDSSLPSRLFSKPADANEINFDSLKQQLKALTDKKPTA
jgi:predicted ATP-binding protein involved in virulence